LPPFRSYQGVDVSSVAINEAPHARALAPGISSGTVAFNALDMRTFPIPASPTWDVIVFAEILYCFDIKIAVEEVQRYAKGLRPGGIVCISMKDDAKSHAIFKQLANLYSWRDGALLQRKPLGMDFR
jgi:hypothetical protein